MTHLEKEQDIMDLHWGFVVAELIVMGAYVIVHRKFHYQGWHERAGFALFFLLISTFATLPAIEWGTFGVVLTFLEFAGAAFLFFWLNNDPIRIFRNYSFKRHWSRNPKPVAFGESVPADPYVLIGTTFVVFVLNFLVRFYAHLKYLWMDGVDYENFM